MKLIYPYVVATIALIIFSSCTSISEFKYNAKEFAEISINEKEKFLSFDNSIKINCTNGDFYYLVDWVLDATNLIISGKGYANLSYYKIPKDIITINLTPEDMLHINITEVKILETILLVGAIIPVLALLYLYIVVFGDGYSIPLF